MYCYEYSALKKITETERGKKFIENLEREYRESYKDKPILAMTYAYVKDYYREGNRRKHEREYFDRRQRLSSLQLLAIAKDEYLEELEEILAAITDEYTWVLPAHNYVPEKNWFDYTEIDLFSAETSFYLAETVYIFGEKLSPDIRRRIRLSIEEKIIKNYESRNFWWDTATNNWAAVCACGVGLSYLYMFPERFEKVKERLLETFAHYLRGIDDDGYCSEGVGYWAYGFGYFSVFFDVYVQLTEDYPKILTLDKVKKTLRYLQNSEMGEGVYLPFSDGGSAKYNTAPSINYAIKNLFGDAFILPKTEESSLLSSHMRHSEKSLGIRILYGMDRYGMSTNLKADNKSIYYESAQVFLYKNDTYSFAAKCGHNFEFHNHNDVGAFQIVKGSERLIVDYGSGEYTNGYFNDLNERYGEKVFVCSSISHSVPIVDGFIQQYGKEYYGKVLEKSDKRFVTDITEAYEKGKFESLIVAYTVEKNGVEAAYSCKGIQKNIIFRFVSEIEPEIKGCKTFIKDLEIVNDAGLLPTIDKVCFSGHAGQPTCLYTIDYKVNGKADVQTKFGFYFNEENENGQ